MVRASTLRGVGRRGCAGCQIQHFARTPSNPVYTAGSRRSPSLYIMDPSTARTGKEVDVRVEDGDPDPYGKLRVRRGSAFAATTRPNSVIIQELTKNYSKLDLPPSDGECNFLKSAISHRKNGALQYLFSLACATGNPVDVNLNVFLVNLDDVDTKNMEVKLDLLLRAQWKDPRLAFRDAQSLRVLDPTVLSAFWLPDLFMNRAHDAEIHRYPSSNEMLRIFGDGSVHYSRSFRGVNLAQEIFQQVQRPNALPHEPEALPAGHPGMRAEPHDLSVPRPIRPRPSRRPQLTCRPLDGSTVDEVRLRMEKVGFDPKADASVPEFRLDNVTVAPSEDKVAGSGKASVSRAPIHNWHFRHFRVPQRTLPAIPPTLHDERQRSRICLVPGTYSVSGIVLHLRRLRTRHFVSFFIPCAFAVFVAYLSLWLRSCLPRVVICVGMMGVLVYICAADSPPVPYTTSRDVWGGFSLVFVTIALIQTVLIDYFGPLEMQQEEDAEDEKKPSKWWKWGTAKCEKFFRISYPGLYMGFFIVFWIGMEIDAFLDDTTIGLSLKLDVVVFQIHSTEDDIQPPFLSPNHVMTRASVPGPAKSRTRLRRVAQRRVAPGTKAGGFPTSKARPQSAQSS
ncbi:unnamed protein product [Darwinula stevensoni]|uniref:Neurotransmitter-gated ion-channel ligand-binding domain-containing protein n=1 Tax=Darwinula stevensoni TaxID=69355 RepID=A0A7R9A203_9CRUS|nr:unnamed protein product [Darwinula stevensoni]CAG0878620.1 unnamed protein product [Darwinula stevensoni]